MRGAWREHVVAPLASVKDELFNTFRRRPTITSMGDYEADRDSLQRMLLDFQVGAGLPACSPSCLPRGLPDSRLAALPASQPVICRPARCMAEPPPP